MALAARQKAAEDKKEGESGKATSRLGTTRKSIGGVANSALASSRIASGRTSALKTADDKEEGSRTSRAAQGSRMRSNSREAVNKDLQFGKTRNTSASRDKDISGLNRTRNSSSSRERLGLTFNKAAAQAAAEAPKLDPNMTTILKTELKELKEAKEENEKNKEELYSLNIKYKKLEFNIE
jgi:hypothetical protein